MAYSKEIVRVEWERVHDKGEKYRHDMLQVLEKLGFPKELIKDRGVLCIDVEFGREIVAFAELNPRRLLATESSDMPLVWQVLGMFDENEQTDQIFSGHPEDILPEVEKYLKRDLLGLITWMNVYPRGENGLSEERLVNFFQSCSGLVCDNGLVLVSGYEGRYDICNSIRGMMKRVAARQISGIEIDFFDVSPRLNTGEYYLVGWM